MSKDHIKQYWEAQGETHDESHWESHWASWGVVVIKKLAAGG